MRKLYAVCFLMLATITVTISCNKDKDDSKPVTIVGKWFAKSYHYQIYINDTLSEEETLPAPENVYFEFLSDGTLKEQDEDGDTFTYTYTYDNNTKKLTTTEDGENYEYDVRKLTESDLVLYGEETEDFEDNTYKYTVEISCKK